MSPNCRKSNCQGDCKECKLYEQQRTSEIDTQADRRVKDFKVDFERRKGIRESEQQIAKQIVESARKQDSMRRLNIALSKGDKMYEIKNRELDDKIDEWLKNNVSI